MNYENTAEFAQEMDQNDPLRSYRNDFHIPLVKGKESLYFCGNSLGLQPKTTVKYIGLELEDWALHGVEGHFNARNPWFSYHEVVKEGLAEITGSKPSEVVAMGSLSANIHFLFASFYRPDGKRNKILCETRPFSSDQYILETQARFHGLDPDETIVEMEPRPGEVTLRTDDILAKIKELGDSLAMVFFGGVNYITGQAFDMASLTRAAHGVGAVAGFDLAHAAGNLRLKLHEWNVDFAAWCSYKYLNSAPGGVAGIFVHEKHGNNKDLPRLAGWWGYDKETRFQMKKGFVPLEGAEGWQLSNAPVLSLAAHKAAIDIFMSAGMDKITEKAVKLTGFMEYVVNEINMLKGHEILQIITPHDPKDRGCQLSIVVKENGRSVFERLQDQGVISDWREPDVIRLAPVPLYNSFTDVYRFGQILKSILL